MKLVEVDIHFYSDDAPWVVVYVYKGRPTENNHKIYEISMKSAIVVINWLWKMFPGE